MREKHMRIVIIRWIFEIQVGEIMDLLKNAFWTSQIVRTIREDNVNIFQRETTRERFATKRMNELDFWLCREISERRNKRRNMKIALRLWKFMILRARDFFGLREYLSCEEKARPTKLTEKEIIKSKSCVLYFCDSLEMCQWFLLISQC